MRLEGSPEIVEPDKLMKVYVGREVRLAVIGQTIVE